MPTHTIEAIFENGVLRPLTPLRGIAEHDRVNVTLSFPSASTVALAELSGTLPDEDSVEMLRIVKQEFEQVDPNDWK